MGVFDWLFGAGKAKSTSTSSIPKWLEDAGRQLFQQGQGVVSDGYAPYGGQLVADWTPQQQKALSLSDSFMPTALQTGSTDIDLSRLGEFMNPFTQSVIDSSISDMVKGSQIAGESMDNAFHSDSAFGDMRQGVFDAENQSQLRQDIGRMSSGLNQQNFSQAMGSLFKLPQFEAQQQGNAMSWLSNLMGMGGLAQGQQQDVINADVGQFQEGRDWDKGQLSWLSSLLGSTPHSKTTTATTPTASPFAQMVGGGLNIASMF